ncbi:DNA primase [Oceanobacillus alkalisoli]|uniref:DNA primase n=1 Tax=Oceanobacillus alkalisoli TaxID=2925113 RepID=UPI001EE421B8|nr:DNA primase [Oceanobacillus alkalisoli]MCG5103072.1 DNA primase [Oceanobacillus alkalisoli]
MRLNQIPEEVIEEVRKANNIVDVVGEYVQLKKQGRNYFGLCPFHGENTPSFSVTQEKQIFHCFGCGKGGNVVTFLMEMESFSFFEAMETLASRSGITLPTTGNEKRSSYSEENQRILEASEWLTKLYNHLLRYTKDGKEGYNYFQDRSILDETIDVFQLGFAPNTKDFIVEFLEKKGFNKQLLIKAGLVSERDDGTVTDRFQGRVIFPIRNHLGKTVAFGGRAIHDQGPKYLNSPESELFQKGRLLYNFDLAKRHIRKENEVILFEGYMDVIAAYQAGIKNVVATLGTALSESQAKLLRRYVNEVIICYDGDDAGQEASFKAAGMLRQAGCTVKVAYLKDGNDPDTFINEHGGEAFHDQIIRASDTYMTFLMRYYKKDYNLSLEADKLNYIQKVLKELSTVESSLEREYYLQELGKEFTMSLDVLKEELGTIQAKYGNQPDKTSENRYTSNTVILSKKRKLLPAYQNAERKILYYMMQNEWVADRVQEELGANFRVDDHKIIVTYLYAFYEDGNSPDISKFLESINDDRLKQLISEIAMSPEVDEISEEALGDYIRMVNTESSDKGVIQSLKEQLKIAEQQSDPIKAAQIAEEILQIQRKLKH